MIQNKWIIEIATYLPFGGAWWWGHYRINPSKWAYAVNEEVWELWPVTIRRVQVKV